MKQSKSPSQRALEVKHQAKLTMRVQNLMARYDASDILNKNTKEKNMRLAHKITDNCKDVPLRDQPLQDLLGIAFANNGEIRAALYEQRLNKMHEQIHDHRVRTLDMISKMAIAHTARNAQTMQKISQMRTEINVKKTHIPKEEQKQYVQELVDCYQMDSDPVLFKRKQGKLAVRETVGSIAVRRIPPPAWVEWEPPAQRVVRKVVEEEDMADILQIVHDAGEGYEEPKNTNYSSNMSYEKKYE